MPSTNRLGMLAHARSGSLTRVACPCELLHGAEAVGVSADTACHPNACVHRRARPCTARVGECLLRPSIFQRWPYSLPCYLVRNDSASKSVTSHSDACSTSQAAIGECPADMACETL